MERLTRHLNKGIPKDAQKSYLTFVRTMVSSNPIIHIDDSDVINRKAAGSRHLDLFVMVLKALILKPFMKSLSRNRSLCSYRQQSSREAYLSHVKVQITASKKILTWCSSMV